MRKLFTIGTAAVMAMAMTVTSFAGEWKWIDQNGDGVAESYYFDDVGNILTNTTTPDGYQVNENGAWVKNGVVQTQAVGGQTEAAAQATDDGVYINGVHHNAGYDPEHPLKNVMDQWNLRQDKATMNWHCTVSSTQIQSMLTGQTDTFIPYEEYNPAFREEARITDEELYQWYCNWLNSWDFENASEMERAQKIKEVLAGIRYDITVVNESYGTSDYRALIWKRAVCADYAMLALSLCKSVGLKCVVIQIASQNHAIYAVRVDGKVYLGGNADLNLDIDETHRSGQYPYPSWSHPDFVWSTDM